MSGKASGVVFDVQHYAVHDGPGIRTLVFLKGCPLRCTWCCNPESQRARPQLRHRVARCRACGSCAAACPADAVTVGAEHASFAWERCDSCADRPCATACPHGGLKVVGGEMTSDEVVERVARDLPFYRNSGGGVTFSGGEPLAQPAFLKEALEGCRALGIHTAVETCGHAPADVLPAVAPLVDLFLFDVKVADAGRHRALTGVDNARVLANLRWLGERFPDRVVLRFPVVPGATDAPENVAAVARLAARLGLRAVEIAPYHGMGHAKYAEIGHLPPAPLLEPPDAAAMARVAALFAEAGLSCATA